MPEEIELSPVDFITVGTIGERGNRVFHLQAANSEQLVTLTMEKEQASALAESIITLLDDIQEQLGVETENADDDLDFDLREPIIPVFRIAQIGLGYDDVRDQLIIIVNELLPDDVEEDPRMARLSGSRAHMRKLAEHTREVVSSGRARPEQNGYRMHY